MTNHSTTPAPTVESKVKAASIASYLGLLALLAILNGVSDTNLVAGLPDVVEVLVAPIIPAAVALVAGYVA
ncbi:hypothetical protein, partial [Streptomyces chattanoogensis]